MSGKENSLDVNRLSTPMEKLEWTTWGSYKHEDHQVEGIIQSYAKIGNLYFGEEAVARMQPSGDRFGHKIHQAHQYSGPEKDKNGQYIDSWYGRGVAPTYVLDVIKNGVTITEERNGYIRHCHHSGSLMVVTSEDDIHIITVITKDRDFEDNSHKSSGDDKELTVFKEEEIKKFVVSLEIFKEIIKKACIKLLNGAGYCKDILKDDTSKSLLETIFLVINNIEKVNVPVELLLDKLNELLKNIDVVAGEQV